MQDEHFYDENFSDESNLEEFPIDEKSSAVGIASVCVNNASTELDNFFSYLVPKRLEFIEAGCRVRVPFGNGKSLINGVVFKVEKKSADEIQKIISNSDFKFKEIYESLDVKPWFSQENLETIRWMADFYLVPTAQVIKMFLPESRRTKISVLYEKRYAIARDISDEELNSFKKNRSRFEALKILMQKKSIDDEERKFFKISTVTLKNLERDHLIVTDTKRVLRDAVTSIVKNPLPKLKFELTKDQSHALERIFSSDSKRFLLHGVTGSGKTYVYMLAAERVRAEKKSVIVLVPEIALTGQMVRAFQANFPGDVAVIHSKLSSSEKSDAMIRIRSGENGIVIGARSSLFTPTTNIGLIIVDEEQDSSYKQDRTPKYSARVVAEEFARIHDAILIFGSATPSIETYYRAVHGEFELLKLPNRIGENPLPKIYAVDMKEEFKHRKLNVISQPMQDLIRRTLATKQQMIILLNRRGFSTSVMCRECGEVVKCPNCNMPMTYHAGNNPRLVCHHCDTQEKIPEVCPKCGSSNIKFLGTGTERLEFELQKKFPNARVIRMDSDTTRRKFSHEEILEKFRNHEFDILLGTQMVSKGHDIPNVTAIGILNADSVLNFSDFRSAEYCFALITQTAGRSGRGKIPGEVVVQAYNLDVPAVIYGVEQSYEKFFVEEIKSREELDYPPFTRLVKLTFLDQNSSASKKSAAEFVKLFKQNSSDEIIGPAPAMIEFFHGFFRFVVLIKTKNLDAVREFLVEHGYNRNAKVSIDIDPVSTS